jgi:archaellum biogenesis ATPase FlaH
MIDSGYPYYEGFQRHLLAQVVQNPKKLLSIMQPHFFTSPIHADIARVVADCHKKYPEAVFIYDFLKDAVKSSLTRNALKNWSLYKKALKAAFAPTDLSDQLFLDSAKEFAKQSIWREMLISAERSVSAGKYEHVPTLVQKAQASTDFGGADTVHWRDLPHPSNYPHQEIEWIIEGLIPAGHVIAISGEEGVGKTLFLLAMSHSISQGTDFLSRQVYATPVIYLGLDVSKATLQNYMKMLRWNPDGDFRILTMWTDPEAPMLDSNTQLHRLYQYVEKYRPVLIFDTLRDFFSGEENSSTETKPILDAIKKMRSLGGTPILITHPAKKGNTAIRGTGNISQKVDIGYFMERVRQNNRDLVRLTCPTKNRAGSPNVTVTVQKQFIPTPAGMYLNIRKIADRELQNKPKQSPQSQKVLTYLREHPNTSQKELASNLGLSDRLLKRLLEELQLRGSAECVKGQRKTLLWSVVRTQDVPSS